MIYLSTAERLGIEKGCAEGLSVAIDGIALALELKFDEAALPVIEEIRQITDLAVIEALMAQIKTAQTVDEVRRAIPPSTS